jgi:hypothetical protein
MSFSSLGDVEMSGIMMLMGTGPYFIRAVVPAVRPSDRLAGGIRVLNHDASFNASVSDPSQIEARTIASD